MQQRVEVARKGPHKSVHCHFCKSPGYSSSLEEPSKASYETKTNITFGTQTAQLKLIDTFEQPGEPPVDSATCLCVLANEPPPCPKCAPDKNRPPPKKRVCKCPPGAIPMGNKMRNS